MSHILSGHGVTHNRGSSSSLERSARRQKLRPDRRGVHDRLTFCRRRQDMPSGAKHKTNFFLSRASKSLGMNGRTVFCRPEWSLLGNYGSTAGQTVASGRPMCHAEVTSGVHDISTYAECRTTLVVQKYMEMIMILLSGSNSLKLQDPPSVQLSCHELLPHAGGLVVYCSYIGTLEKPVCVRKKWEKYYKRTSVRVP